MLCSTSSRAVLRRFGEKRCMRSHLMQFDHCCTWIAGFTVVHRSASMGPVGSLSRLREPWDQGAQ